MKFSLIAAVVLLALAQGSFAQDMPDLERLGQYLEEMKTKMVQDLTEILRNHEDLANQAQTFVADRKTQLEPLVAQMQEQVKTIAANVEEQIKPMAANVQTQFQPQLTSLFKMVEGLVERIKEQNLALPSAN
ncbi:type-4 ice-structuring protein LS-12-like [Sebastes fasciatus]|uniref:type-4 ice-structuring protein LS-12-like n=1 Tax=Sebastes fasciatus TaxID=394691 RepID=UPI003D9F600B